MFVLHQIRPHAMHDTGHASAHCCATSGFNADKPCFGVDKTRENTDGIRTATNTSRNNIGIFTIENIAALRERFVADDALKCPNHERVRMRPHDRAKCVIRCLDSCDPVSHCLIHRILECATSRHCRNYFSSKQLHAKHIQRLALHVYLAHVHLALQTQQGCSGRRSNAVLPSACLGNDSLLAHSLGKKYLAEHAIDLVRARVIQIFAF